MLAWHILVSDMWRISNKYPEGHWWPSSEKGKAVRASLRLVPTQGLPWVYLAPVCTCSPPSSQGKEYITFHTQGQMDCAP